MTPYAMKARALTRQAWIAFGKAREAKFNVATGTNPMIQEIDRHMVAHHVRVARMAMGTATIYRQMDGRL
jgi:hypothetical protein